MSTAEIIVSVLGLAIFAGIMVVCITGYTLKKRSVSKKKKIKKDVDYSDASDAISLKLKKIVKVYGEGENAVNALKGINLDFRKNEFVSILGPSGCGKTTLLNIVGGLDRYTSGDLVINGVSTKHFTDADWDTYRNNSIGFVFQSYNLIPHQTVIKNVELALTLSGVSASERHERAKAVLEKVGLKGQAHKLPNQLSGGQMQRVAIARALVNDPEIILADEPTGALDTDTSLQVMDLLKEVAHDRLVIMVTHNPDLAEKYSTRIIRLLDGEKTGDTNPPADVGFSKPKNEEKGRAAMKVGTAFALSLSNLRTKKGRTTMTSIAGSIGIIGIALVLAVSTGFSGYVNRLQSETLSVYPLSVSESTVDLSDFDKLMHDTGLEKFPLVEKVYTKKMFSDLTNMLKSNKLTGEYLKYVEDFAEEQNAKEKDGWKYCLQKGYGFDVNNYIFANINFMDNVSVMPVDQLVYYLQCLFDEGLKNSEMNISSSFVREYIPTMSEIPDSRQLIESQYDLLSGEWATEENELLLVVDSKNCVTDITLALLGFRSLKMDGTNYEKVEFGGDEEFTFDEVIGKEFYYLDNDTRYSYIGGNTFFQNYYTLDTLPENAMKMKITGIVRIKESVSQGVLDTGLAYTSSFVQKIIENNIDSEVVSVAEAQEDKTVYIKSVLDTSGSAGRANSVRKLAGSDQVTKLQIYSIGYEAKEEMKTHLDGWNDTEGRSEEDNVYYSDSTAMLFSALNSIVDAVKIVLIAFTAISLVVSSIMIGIITYVSVVERTKEIGVLRSIGARKKDISRIFNAETFLIGLFAGILGVLITYILSVPINLILAHFIKNVGNIAALKITDALILVVISFVLTLIAGVIPARIAAEKDPVVALRSE